MGKLFRRHRGKMIWLVLVTLIAFTAWYFRPRPGAHREANGDMKRTDYLPLKEWGFGTTSTPMGFSSNGTPVIVGYTYKTKFGPFLFTRIHLNAPP